MGLFNRKSVGTFMDTIRCDEPSYLIWKWRPQGSVAGNNSRENAIRWGSSLRVKDGEVAVFVYNQDGTQNDFIVGPYDATLETANLPILSSIIGLAYGGKSPFQAEIYFINLANLVQVKFGVPFFDVYDPRFPDFGVPVAVRGTINFKIEDYQAFIKLHRLVDFDLKEFQTQIKDAVTRYVKDAVANAPAANNIPLVQIESKTTLINDAIEYDIAQRLKESFGVTVTGVDIGAIELDKSSDGYAQLMAVTKNTVAATVQAQTAAQVKDLQDKQRIEAENYQESLRIQREESQYAQRKQTQTTHFAAYQTEAQAQVGTAGAEALGKMGTIGAGGVNLGGNAGFNPAAMMAGMTLGSAVGQNIAGAMNHIMAGANTQAVVPPPIPMAMYHIAVNGQATGPFNLETLKQMAGSGAVTTSSLVWKKGMTDWAQAGSLQELAALWGAETITNENDVPPIPPTI